MKYKPSIAGTLISQELHSSLVLLYFCYLDLLTCITNQNLTLGKVSHSPCSVVHPVHLFFSNRVHRLDAPQVSPDAIG